MTRQLKPQLDPAIDRVRLGSLTIFEITEAELDALERGSPESVFLNLGIAALSIASSFFTAILTTKLEDTRTFCVFVIICVIGFISGIAFGLLWWQSHRSLKNVARDIRNRKPPEGVQEIGEAPEKTAP